jgi:RimJ/RimL family protein N-acetyltransferase
VSVALSIPVLETERLRLRAWREEDLGPFAEFCANEATAKFVGGVSDRAGAWRRMAAQAGHWQLRGYGSWVLEEKAQAGFIGYCGFWNPEGWPERELMWGLVADCHGRGFATEAARCARDYAYGRLGWNTAISCIDSGNNASLRVAERLGARYERSAEVGPYRFGIYRHPGPEKPQS